MHAIYVNNGKDPVAIQPSTHAWRPAKGLAPWRVVDTSTGAVIESYQPPRPPVRAKPITSFRTRGDGDCNQ